jgi:uncharacterized protein YfaS (alpha-2-macroglobulin family)
LSVWVAGIGESGVRETTEPSLSIRFDRKSYRPGEKIKVWIDRNTAKNPILVTAEGEELWNVAVLPGGKKHYLWNVTAKPEMFPHISVNAVQWTRNQPLMANHEIPIIDQNKLITVSIEPESPVYQPGSPVKYYIKTLDSRKKPVSAEVAVAVVDEAIYALRPDNTPNLFQTFWTDRPNLITTYFSAPEELSCSCCLRDVRLP